MVQLFEEQAKKTPKNIAVVYEAAELNYRELDERSNQLAHYLQKEWQVQPESIVAVYQERSLDLVISLLGILKAGAAYLPLDTKAPIQRINFMLKDSQAICLLSTKDLLDQAKTVDANTCIPVDQLDLSAYSIKPLKLQAKPTNLAYVIYTSGSTGQPKGVMIPHQGYTNVTVYYSQLFDLGFSTRCSQYSNLAFDASLCELMPPLISGSRLFIVPDKIKYDPGLLTQFFLDYKIDHVFLPTAMYQSASIKKLSNLTSLVVAGEKLITFFEEKCRVYNGYGPTECTVYSTIFPLSKGMKIYPIGKPIRNVQVYIVDKNFNPVPIGVSGELLIGGVGVARGYLNRPELTAEKFIANPFSDNPNDRVYRTGDLCRYLADGNIEYLGRIDFQVKIRGFRVELGEIESTLLSLSQVKAAVVLAHGEAEEKRLVAYLVPSALSLLTSETVADQQSEWITAVKASLKELLPEYMIPSYYVLLESLPLTANGKVDRKGLPDFDSDQREFKQYVAAKTATEKFLVTLWTELLGVKRIGINDNFFDLGGNSLLSIRLISKVNREMKAKVSIADVFRKPVLSEFARLLDCDESSVTFLKHYSIKSREKKYPLAFFFPAAMGGSEIYQEISTKLSNTFDCVGLDWMTELTHDHSTSLVELVKFYADAIFKNYSLKKDQEIVLFGWSLGGKFALQFAHLLEEKKYKKVKVILFDTQLNNKGNKYELPFDQKYLIKEELLLRGYENNYIKSLLKNYDLSINLDSENIKSTLSTKV